MAFAAASRKHLGYRGTFFPLRSQCAPQQRGCERSSRAQPCSRLERPKPPAAPAGPGWASARSPAPVRARKCPRGTEPIAHPRRPLPGRGAGSAGGGGAGAAGRAPVPVLLLVLVLPSFISSWFWCRSWPPRAVPGERGRAGAPWPAGEGEAAGARGCCAGGAPAAGSLPLPV